MIAVVYFYHPLMSSVLCLHIPTYINTCTYVQSNLRSKAIYIVIKENKICFVCFDYLNLPPLFKSKQTKINVKFSKLPYTELKGNNRLKAYMKVYYCILPFSINASDSLNF